MSIRIGSREVGREHRPFVIAEMSGNHAGSLERALSLVDIAADAGADAVKLQTYTADTMTLDVDRDEFRIQNPQSLWFGRTLHDLYDEAHTPWDWHAPLMQRARERGIQCFSTPFDTTAVDFLESLDVPCYKIASSENIDIALIRAVAATGKPVIISTGLANFEEVDEAVAAARDAGCTELVVLKCTASYPARPEDSNLATIAALRDRYACEIGLSDHTLGTATSVAAVALGATVLEKHFTISRTDGAVDSAFSLEPDELRQLVVETGIAHRSIGAVVLEPTELEQGALTRRRSLYFSADVRAGEELTPANVRSIRPGLGLKPKHLEALLGRRAKVDIARGTPTSWDLVASDD